MKRLSRLVLLSGFVALVGCGGADPGDVQAQATNADDVPTGTIDASEEPLVLAETDGGVPTVLYGNFRNLSTSEATRESFAASLEQAALTLRVPAGELEFLRAERDELGYSHARYAQTHNGLEVIGGDVRLHADSSGRVFALNGSVALSSVRPDEAQVDADTAGWVAGEEARLGLSLTVTATPRLVYLVTDDAEGSRLAWEVVVEGESNEGPVLDFAYVDALSSSLLATHPKIHFAQKREVYTAKNGSSLPGTKMRAEGDPATTNVDVEAAYDNLGFVYSFFNSSFGLDSYDGKGATMKATVNYGRNYNNAFWNGRQMVFGDGDGDILGPLARSIDVTAHEMTHAVTEYSSNLVYSGESGGLNEAMSDIFGNTVEAWARGDALGFVVDERTWLVGEDVWTPSTPGDALRYMDDPTKDGDSLDDFKMYRSGVDVHYSSGIANLAYKLLVTGGKHPRGKTSVEVPALGIEKAAAIFYRANSKYMNSRSNFQAARVATAQAATDLFDADAVAAVHKAWDAVNVPGSPGGGGTSSDTLIDDKEITGISGERRSATYFKIEVPSGATSLEVVTSGGSGNADLYIRYNKKPSSTWWGYDKKSTGDANNERVSVSSPKTGTYWVMVRGADAYSNLSIVARY